MTGLIIALAIESVCMIVSVMFTMTLSCAFSARTRDMAAEITRLRAELSRAPARDARGRFAVRKP